MGRFPRSFSKAGRYGQAVGRIMVHESTLLNRQQVERMVDSLYRDALAVSLETLYGPYIQGSTTAHEIESGLMRCLADEYAFMDEICSGTLVAEFMHLKYDYHNLRAMLKIRYFGDSAGDELFSDLGSTDLESLRALVERGAAQGVPERLCRLVGKVTGAEGVDTDPQVVDTIVDRAFLEDRLALARMERSRLLVAFCKAAIDVANLRLLLRGMNLDKPPLFYEAALASGGRLERTKLIEFSAASFEEVSEKLLDSEYGRMLSDVLVRGADRARLTSLDRATDEYLLERIRGMSVVSMGPERIIRYMLTRESEVAVLRVIFMGKLHYLSSEVIAARLPAAYSEEPGR